jgi:HK97 family phage portal protein
MRIFGRELTFKRKSAPMSPPGTGLGGWYPWISEPYSGAWQNNDSWTNESVLAHYAVYACVTLIANDIGKLRPRLMQLDANGIWTETASAAFSPVLKKPNNYQNHIQFKQWWQTSKLTNGNAYGLKQRDQRGVVTSIYLLDPCRVLPLVTPDGSIYYQLSNDNLNRVGDGITVPASEMIHDRMNCLFHPLVGVSPLYACALAACQSLKMQNDSSTFFENGARPGGILSAPGAISDETAARLKAHWDANYTGTNAGKVAVVGDDLKFQQMRMSATDSQLIEQFKLTAEMICTAFHVPGFKVGVGPMPAGTAKIADLNQIYYSDCLQSLIEEFEACMDDGLALPDRYGVELDLDGLLRMDLGSLVETLKVAVGAGIMAPDEARKRLNMAPVEGGATPYLQQQNYSLSSLSRRDNSEDPFGTAQPTTQPSQPAAPPEPTDEQIQDSAKMLALLIEKRLANEPA